MRSMTGFGRATCLCGDRRFAIEVRAVNHRGLDVKVRARDLDAHAELEVIKAVRTALERGAVVVAITEESQGSEGFPRERVRSVHRELEALRQELHLSGQVDLSTVAAFMTVAGAAGATSEEVDLWTQLKPALSAALERLAEMRGREGEALAADIGRRLTTLERLSKTAHGLCAALPTRAARRLQDRIAALVTDGVDAGRLAQEVALLAERLDVSEELTRLDTHLSHLRTLADPSASSAVGRKMDFVIQEVGRELNTLGSKVQDAEVVALVIEAKAELEKIREQAQNVE